VEIRPEPRQVVERLDISGIFYQLSITAFAAIMGSLASTHDHAKAVLAHRDKPDNTGKTPDQEP
jgi:hypothetical protein